MADTTTTAATTVDLFVIDKSFINPSLPYHEILTTGGVGRLDQTGLSYFVDLYTDSDTRAPSARQVSWTAEYSPQIFVDNSYYSTFVTALSAAPQAARDAVFIIIDRLLFDSTATTSADADLTANTATKDYYVAGSAAAATTPVTDTVYSGSPATAQAFTGAPYATFTVTIPSGDSTLSFIVTAFSQNAAWLERYPNTTILAIAPPIDYNNLLTMALSTATSNTFATAISTVNINFQALYPSLDTKTSSGYLIYTVVVNDAINNTTTSAPFAILYKGSTPSQLQMRVAVKNAVLASGYGDEASWKARIPDLFVDKQFILTPLYDITYTQSADRVIYPNVVNLNTVLTKVGKIFTSVDPTTIQSKVELLLASYEKIWIAAMEDVASEDTDSSGDTTATTIAQMFPTYQCYATTDTNFQFMDTATQQFVTTLSTVLAIAMGNATSTVYLKTEDKDLEYISFVMNSVEFCVITPACYTSLQGATT